jgi:hypothetical protein
MLNTTAAKISEDWIRKTRKEFRWFLKETRFPNPVRTGERGPKFEYPEWLIMFIAILAVKCKLKTYQGIHRLTTQYWEVIAERLRLSLISERQLRDRLKKICHFPGRPAAFVFQIFPELEQEYRRECRQDDEQGQRACLAQEG